MTGLPYTLMRSAFVIGLILNGSATGQTNQATGASDAQVLQELVSEVRQLRLALERSSAINSRLQLTLQRVQLQQGQVNAISGQLAAVRNEIARMEAEQAQNTSHASGLDEQVEQEQNPIRQKDLQAEQKRLKALLEQKARVIQDEKAREGELAGALQSEQSKLNELQTRLASLEALLPTP